MLVREGTTPARLRDLKAATPPSRSITKTDLAKYVHAWQQRPHLVSLGGQKNFQVFNEEVIADGKVPDLTEFKRLIAMAIIFKRADKLIKPAFQGFQANITTYTVATLSKLAGPRLSLEAVWQQQ